MIGSHPLDLSHKFGAARRVADLLRHQNWFALRRLARIILASAMLITVISSQALAERTLRGVVVKVDGIIGIISVRQMHADASGATSYGAPEQFKVQDGLLFDAVRLGDEVMFSASEMNGAMTITKLSEQ
jgi:hypothetical protein